MSPQKKSKSKRHSVPHRTVPELQNTLFHSPLCAGFETLRSLNIWILECLWVWFRAHCLSQFVWAAITVIPQTWCLKQQTCISYHSGDWEMKDQHAGRFDIWWEPASQSIDSHLLTVSSHNGGSERALGWGGGSLFYVGTNPTHESSSLMT